MQNTEPIIQISKLTFTYGSDTHQPVLRDLDLQVAAGESVALMGANGSGKTTLARCLNGLLLPSEGNVWIDGKNTRDAAQLQEIRRLVGMVFQNPETQIVSTTVEREIAFGLENLGVEHDRMHEIVDEMLARFDLQHCRRHAPHLLSGGEMQRLAIAAVMAMAPRVIVFDEPTSLLDPVSCELAMSTIADLQSKVGGDGQAISMVLVTQNPAEALFCDRLLVLSCGRILFDDKPNNVFQHVQELHDCGVAVPAEYEIQQYMSKELGLRNEFEPLEFQRQLGEFKTGRT